MLIVHVSDIHFRHPECAGGADPDKPFRTMLGNDLRAMVASLGVPIDAILVTGDIAFRGAKQEFDAAEAWLTSLANEFGQPRSSIFVVPGNHDVDRNLCRTLMDVRNVQRSLRSAANPHDMERELRAQLGDAATSRSILKPIEAYNDFAAKFDCNLFAPEKTHWNHDIRLEHGVTLRLHGWNSTLLSGFQGNDDARGDMYLSGLQTVLDPIEGVVNAVLAHHPPDWCKDNDDIEDAISTRAHLHFFGHKHRQRIVQEERYVRYSAGAVNPDRHEAAWEPGYNLIRLSVAVEGTARRLRIESHVRTLRAGDMQFDYRRPQAGGDDWHYKELRITGIYHGEQAAMPPKSYEPVPITGGEPMTDPVLPESARDRDLVFRFWSLPMSARRGIANTFGLLEPGEMLLKEAERYGRALLRAKERGLLEQLAQEISKSETH